MTSHLPVSLAGEHAHAQQRGGSDFSRPSTRDDRHGLCPMQRPQSPAVSASEVLRCAYELLIEFGWLPCHATTKKSKRLHVLEAMYKACMNRGSVPTETQQMVSDLLIAASPHPPSTRTVTAIESEHMRSFADVQDWIQRAIEQAIPPAAAAIGVRERS